MVVHIHGLHHQTVSSELTRGLAHSRVSEEWMRCVWLSDRLRKDEKREKRDVLVGGERGAALVALWPGGISAQRTDVTQQVPAEPSPGGALVDAKIMFPCLWQ